MLFDELYGQSPTMNDLHVRLLSAENKIDRLESVIENLKSQNQDLETKIELKEVQADVSFILMEQAKLNDRNRPKQYWTCLQKRELYFKNICLALIRLEELEAEKPGSNVVDVSNEIPRSNSPMQIQMEFSGKLSSRIFS